MQSFSGNGEHEQTRGLLSLGLDLETIKDKGYGTHNFHPYPAKFVPQIPGALLDNDVSSPDSVIVDPFCGSGTTLVEAAMRGFRAVGMDINPIAVLVSRAKTMLLDQDERRSLRSFIAELSFMPHSYGAPVRFPNIEHWFEPQAIDELTALRNRIDELSAENDAVANYARCAFSAIIVRCSRQEGETSWRAVDRPYVRGTANRLLQERLSSMLERTDAYASHRAGKVDVLRSDASASWQIRNASVDYVVTSPPYANSHDYYLYHKLRMQWLGYDHYTVQRDEIGSRNRISDNGESVESYLDSVGAAFREARRVLRTDGAVSVVVGDSIVRGRFIDMGERYVKLLLDCGFELTRHLRFDQRRFTASFNRSFKTRPKTTHVITARKGSAA